MEKIDYYSNYTSTQALSGSDEAVQTRVAGDSFRFNILPHLPASKDSKVLDVACGYGRYLKALGGAGYNNAVGVDLSMEQVRFAKERLQLQNVVEGDGLAYMENSPSSFDAILMLDILEHLKNEDVLKWIQIGYRALLPGGTLAIRVPNAVTPVSVHFHGDFTHERAYSGMSMAQALRVAGVSDFQSSPSWEAPTRPVSTFRYLLWKGLTPIIKLTLKILYGGTAGGVYTANLLAVVRKPE